MNQNKLSLVNLKVGITVFIGIVIFFFFIIMVGREVNYFSRTYRLKVFLENVEGISVGSMVTLGGIKIGSVERMDFSKKNGINGIDVIFAIRQSYQSRITKNSFAELKNKGLLGDRYIDLSMGQDYEEPLKDGDYVPLKLSSGLNDITQKFAPILDSLNNIIVDIRKFSINLTNEKSGLGYLINNKELGEKINFAIDNLTSVLYSIKNKNGTLGKLVYNDSLYENLNSLSNNLQLISKQIVNEEGLIGKLISNQHLYQNIENVAQNITRLTSKLESDSTVIGSFLNNKELYRNLTNTITELNLLIKDLRENPSKYVHISVF